MMVSAGLALPWVGSTLPSVMYRLGTAKLRQVAVDHAVAFVGGHPGPADQMGEALDGDHLIGPGRVQDVLHDPLRGVQQLGVVVALASR